MPRTGRPKTPIRDRFFTKVNKTGTCWLWIGHTNHFGYGMIKHNYRHLRAHRVSWELHFGKIPDGLLVCHHCDNPPCVNPEHLFLGTDKDNMGDARKKNRVFMAHGTKSGCAKLTEKQVIEIRHLYDSKQLNQTQLANRFGVNHRTINYIVLRYTWKHI